MTFKVSPEDLNDGACMDTINQVIHPKSSKASWGSDPRFLDLDEELSPVATWCVMDNRPALQKTGITLFQAKQKQGKSYLTYALLIPLLSGREFDTIQPLDKPARVVVFDMEMSKRTLQKRGRELRNTLGANWSHVQLCPLKHIPWNARLEIIREVVNDYNPEIVVIDQAAQLLCNINDQQSAYEIVQALEDIGQNRSVWVVIHENRDEEKHNARGAIGTNLTLAQVETYRVEKKKGYFECTPLEARDTDPDGHKGFNFALNEAGGIVSAYPIIQQVEGEQKENCRDFWTKIFGSDTELPRKEIAFRMGFEDSRSASVGRVIKEGIEFGILENSAYGKYKLSSLT